MKNNEKQELLRLFIAVELPDVLKKEIIEHVKQLPFWKWCSPKVLHMTMRFIGDTRPEDAEVMAKDFEDAFFGFRMIRFTPVGCGFFPNDRKANSFHITMQKSHAIEELKSAVDAFVESRTGLAPEKGGFTPHVTIMRLNKPPVKLDYDRIMKWAGKYELSEPFAERITLFKSETGRFGVVHTPLASAELSLPR